MNVTNTWRQQIAMPLPFDLDEPEGIRDYIFQHPVDNLSTSEIDQELRFWHDLISEKLGSILESGKGPHAADKAVFWGGNLLTGVGVVGLVFVIAPPVAAACTVAGVCLSAYTWLDRGKSIARARRRHRALELIR